MPAPPRFINSAVTGLGTGTSYALTMPTSPAPAKGQGLLAVVSVQGGAADAMAAPWDKRGTITNGTRQANVWARPAVGGGGDSGTVTSVSSLSRIGQVLLFDDWSGDTADIGLASAGSVTLDPPNLDMTVVQEYLWIAICRNDNTVTAPPTNYAGTLIVASNVLATARRALKASAENPGVFTAGVASGALAGMVAIAPRRGSFMPFFA